MNVNDVLRRVQNNLGDDSGIIVELADVQDAVNDAVLDIVRQIESPVSTQTINVVAGTFEYAVSADFVLAKRVTYNGHRLIASSIEEIDSLDPDAYNATINARGVPEMFYIEAGFIGLYPIPVDSVTGGLVMRYVQKPADVTTGTDAVPLPVTMHPVVARLCTALFKERDEDYEASSFVRGDAYGLLAKVKDQTLHATSDNFPVIREKMDSYW